MELDDAPADDDANGDKEADKHRDESMLLTRFVLEPLDPAKVAEATEGDENLSAEDSAALELRCSQQHPEVALHCAHGKANTSYSNVKGAFAACNDGGPCYLHAEGRSPMQRPKAVELRTGKWVWEVLIDDLPAGLSKGQLHVGVMNLRSKAKEHAGFVFDFGAKETRVIEWTTEQVTRGSLIKSDVSAHELQQGSCMALMLDLPSATDRATVAAPVEKNALEAGDGFTVTGAGEPSCNGQYMIDSKKSPKMPEYIRNQADKSDNVNWYIKVDDYGERIEDCGISKTSQGTWFFWITSGSNGVDKDVPYVSVDDNGTFPPLMFDGGPQNTWRRREDSGPSINEMKISVGPPPVRGSLSLLLRKAASGNDGVAIEEMIANIPDGQILTPYVVWQPGVGREPMNLMLLSSNHAMQLDNKDGTFFPIESKEMSRAAREKMKARMDEQLRLQGGEQHAAVTWRSVATSEALVGGAGGTGGGPRLQLRTEASAMVATMVGNTRLVAISGDRRPVRLRTGSWWVEFELRSLDALESGQVRFGVLSDRMSDKEAAGFTLELGPARERGKVTAHEWGSSLRGGVAQSTSLTCASGVHRVALQLTFPDAGAEVATKPLSWTREDGTFDDLHLGQRVVLADEGVCEVVLGRDEWTQVHRYYCGLAAAGEVVELISHSDFTIDMGSLEVAEAERQLKNTFKQQLARVLGASSACADAVEIRAIAPAPSGARGHIVVTVHAAVVTPEAAAAMLETLKRYAARPQKDATSELGVAVVSVAANVADADMSAPHLMGCRVRLFTGVGGADKSLGAPAAAAAGAGTGIGTATGAGHRGGSAPILKFVPGCLLDSPDKKAKVGSKRGCLMLFYRDGDKAWKVHSHKSPIFSLPGGTAVKPFLEWLPHDPASSRPFEVSSLFASSAFELRDDRHHLPLVSDQMERAMKSSTAKTMWGLAIGWEQRFKDERAKTSQDKEALELMAAVNKIAQRFAYMMQKKFVAKLQRRVAVRYQLEEQGKLSSMERRIGESHRRELSMRTGSELLVAFDDQAKQRLKDSLKGKQDRIAASRGKVRNMIKGLMFRDKNGVLTATEECKKILRAKHQALRDGAAISEKQAEKMVQDEDENVSQMLKQFEVSRLAKGGFFDAEAELDRLEAARANESRARLAAIATAEPLDDRHGMSNDELLAAAQKAVTRNAVTLSMGIIGDISLPPPNRTEEQWLVDCVKLFREPLELALKNEVPKPEAYIEKLKKIVQGHAGFIEDQAVALNAIRRVLEEVTEGDRQGGSDKKGGKRTDFDSEMVQEQQQEEEKQKEQEQEQQDQVEHDNEPRVDAPWALSDLQIGAKGRMTGAHLIGNAIKPLSSFKMVRAAKTLPSLPSLGATGPPPSHLPLVTRGRCARRRSSPSPSSCSRRRTTSSRWTCRVTAGSRMWRSLCSGSRRWARRTRTSYCSHCARRRPYAARCRRRRPRCRRLSYSPLLGRSSPSRLPRATCSARRAPRRRLSSASASSGGSAQSSTTATSSTTTRSC